MASLLAASSGPLPVLPPTPMPIRLVYSSKDGCRPSFKHRDGVQEDDSPHPTVEFVLFRMPVWGLVGCACLWCSGSSGAWESHSFLWSSLCHIARPNTRGGQKETAVLESCSSWAECILGISVITGVEGGELSKEMCQG